eukprot:CAMPEP_0170859830 /NCGR_PEP_ID=MMETSP0734-20130129/17012_1 /TAXON_ID=186038 /ORGANISM="Fragilariopsis kerguelensis, Strain L26-C5" /LENGTH=166 /DNA_ID=CAMNT_0011233115 /DNA_START=117 /DNA_END=614 /DNA_ORIENTATION=-
MVASSSNFMLLRSTSTNNISGMSTGNLKDMVMLKTVAPTAAPAAALSSKNGAGFSSIKTCNKKKNKCLSDGNLQNLLSVLETVVPPPLPVIATAAAASTDDDDLFLGDEEEEDSISDDATPPTPGRKSSNSSSPQKKEEKKITSIRAETTMKRKDTTIRVPIIENR